jgi:hypothetical protein
MIRLEPTKGRELMPTKPEDDYTKDECPMCKVGLPKSVMVPAELPDGQKVFIKMSGTAYETLQRLIAER